MRRAVPLLLLVFVVVGAAMAVRSGYIPVGVATRQDERTDGTYVSIVDEAGAVLHMTGHMLQAGDEWVTDDDRRFVITRVEGDIAFTQFRGKYSGAGTPPGTGGFLAETRPDPAQAQTTGAGQIAIYHTHSDESYVPSEGTSSVQGRGGVYQVGRALKDALTRRGVQVTQDLTSHNPHDGSAYQRSRRTAMALLRRRPSALLDIHRDAAPPQAYSKQVKGQNVTQVVMVIGKGNPKWSSNAAFARRVKAEVDKTAPGLIKGLMFRNGVYNQDLSTRALLFEVGAHTNERQQAEQAMSLISTAVASAAGSAPTAETSRGGWSALGWVLGLTILGVVGYMFVSTGSLKEAFAKLDRFAREDLAGFLGRTRRQSSSRRKQPPEPDHDDQSGK
ncbi:MAG: stage II sporulation protein P [Bacillota bacterium]|nr:stage II sporulation protein P [Bacillota bacterium]